MRFCYLLGLLLTLMGCSHSPAGDGNYEHLVIVGTNDIHGYMLPRESDVRGSKLIRGGMEWFAAHAHALEEKYGDHLILLDGGDLFQGTLESNTFYGAPVMDAYNQLPYRASAVGNHEFDYGPEKPKDADIRGALKARMREAKFPFLAANIYYKGTRNLWTEKNLAPSTMLNVAGVKIGVIGLTTRSTVAKTLPFYIHDLEFGDLLEATQRESAALRKQGADLIFLTMHEGGEKPGSPLYELLRTLPPGTVTAVVSGHTHFETHQYLFGVPVIQSKTQGLFFGRIDLYVDKRTHRVNPLRTVIHDMQPICGNWLADLESCDGRKAGAHSLPLRPVVYEGKTLQADLRTRKALEPYLEKVEVSKKEILGRASRDFRHLKNEETEVAGIFTASLREKFPWAKAVYINGGSFRRMILKGPITYGDLYEVHPFDNQIAEVQMTGKEFKELLKLGVSGDQSLPVLSGVELVYHRGFSPDYERDINQDGKKEAWERDRLVSATWQNGSPIRDEEVFWVATNNYLVSGGDHCDFLFDAIPAERKHYIDMNMRDAAAEYLRHHSLLKLPIVEPLHLKSVP